MIDIKAELLGGPLDGETIALHLESVYLGTAVQLEACDGFDPNAWGMQPVSYTAGYYILSKQIAGGDHWEAEWRVA